MMNFKAGDTVCHFKRELCSEDDLKRDPELYLYSIIGVAENTENGEQLMIYKALYGDRMMFARPLEMFCSTVDRGKYPTVKQCLRFEKFNR